MKIQGNGSKPVDIQKAKQNKAAEEHSPAKLKASKSGKVDAKTSQALQALEKAISETSVTPGQAHSNVDEKRVQSLLDSFERVEAKRPVLPDEKLMELADRLSEQMESRPEAALNSFDTPSAERVGDLLHPAT